MRRSKYASIASRQVDPVGVGEPLDLETHEHRDDFAGDLLDIEVSPEVPFVLFAFDDRTDECARRFVPIDEEVVQRIVRIEAFGTQDDVEPGERSPSPRCGARARESSTGSASRGRARHADRARPPPLGATAPWSRSNTACRSPSCRPARPMRPHRCPGSPSRRRGPPRRRGSAGGGGRPAVGDCGHRHPRPACACGFPTSWTLSSGAARCVRWTQS